MNFTWQGQEGTLDDQKSHICDPPDIYDQFDQFVCIDSGDEISFHKHCPKYKPDEQIGSKGSLRYIYLFPCFSVSKRVALLIV